MYRIFSDECIHKDMIEALKSAGHVVETIYESGMSGATDAEVFDYATKNDLVLFTFDRGFGDIFKFNISNSSGIAIELINSMNKTEMIDIAVAFFSEDRKLKSKLVIIGIKKKQNNKK